MSKNIKIENEVYQDIDIISVESADTAGERYNFIDEGISIKLNIAYGNSAPSDTTKRWIKCEQPTKVIIDNKFPAYAKNTAGDLIINAYNANAWYGVNIYNGKRLTASTSSSNANGCPVYYRTYDKDSNTYTDTTYNLVSTSSNSYRLSGYGVFYKDEKYTVTVSYYSSAIYGTYIYYIDLKTGQIKQVSKSKYERGYMSTIAITDSHIYYIDNPRSTTQNIYQYSIADGQIIHIKDVTSDNNSDMLFQRGFFYNNTLYYFKYKTKLLKLDILSKVYSEVAINIETVNYNIMYQDDNKIYYNFSKEGILYVKYFDLNTYQTVLIKEIPNVTSNMYIGSYDTNALLLCLTLTPSYKVQFYYKVPLNNLVINTEPTDYLLVNTDNLQLKGEPSYAFLGNSQQEAEEQDVLHYVSDESKWVLYGDPKLTTPMISLSESTLTITEVTNATKYIIFKDETQFSETTSLTIDLSTLITESGTYSITAKAACELYYLNSPTSNAVSYTKL